MRPSCRKVKFVINKRKGEVEVYLLDNKKMKSNKKRKSIVLGTIAVVGLLSMGTVFAGYGSFYFDVPRMQGWVNTEDNNGNGYITGTSASNALVSLEGFDGISEITFYAGAWKNNGNSEITWASNGTVMSRNDFESGYTDATVNYEYTYGSGQKMGLKARNHNWSLNTGRVSGVVDYH